MRIVFEKYFVVLIDDVLIMRADPAGGTAFYVGEMGSTVPVVDYIRVTEMEIG